MTGYGNPTDLYRSADLMDGYDPDDPLGFTTSFDFRMFQKFIADGGTTPDTLEHALAQAGHDASISDALKRFLKADDPKLVGIMGGHSLIRSETAYRDVALLARLLTQEGYLIVTGGGPGAMEAAHLGAMFAEADEPALDAAITIVKKEPELPFLDGVVNSKGEIDLGRKDDLDKARKWMNAALEARETAPKKQRNSLAVPTWLYGQEPTMPFASHYAKYFQNSIREETMITQSRAGIVYARGGGGTMREIFEDTEQNYYVADATAFTPMIFFDAENYWERDATFDAGGKVVKKGIKLDDTMRKLFTFARARQKDADACLKKVSFTTKSDEISRILEAHAPVAQENLVLALTGQSFDVSTAVFNRDA